VADQSEAVRCDRFLANFELKVDVCDAISVRYEGGAIGTLASTGGIPAAQIGHQQHELGVYRA